MESQADNMSKYGQLVRSNAVKKVVELVTFLVVPIGLFAAIMSVGEQSLFMERNLGVLDNVRFWQLVAMSFLAPVLVVLTGAAVERIRAGYRSIRGRRKARILEQKKFSRGE